MSKTFLVLVRLGLSYDDGSTGGRKRGRQTMNGWVGVIVRPAADTCVALDFFDNRTRMYVSAFSITGTW
jgi:hypothetical protein